MDSNRKRDRKIDIKLEPNPKIAVNHFSYFSSLGYQEVMIIAHPKQVDSCIFEWIDGR